MKSIKEIMEEVNNAALKQEWDSVGVELNKEYGLFIQLEGTNENERYYFVEPNEIVDGYWEPLDNTIISVSIDTSKEVEKYLDCCKTSNMMR